MKNVLIILVAAFFALALSSQAHATSASCSGKLTGAYTISNGGVVIRGVWLNNWTQICNLEREWKGISPQICWAWFSQANTAVAEGKSVQVYYPPGTNMTCDQLPTYGSAPAPHYIMLLP